jgi:riboflavin-specific deaminase-like protein
MMFVFSNLATSIDGKIATHNRAHVPFGTPADRKQMRVLRKRADAIIQGASTLRAFKRPLLIAETGRQAINIVVSSKLEGISPSWPFFTDPRTLKMIFVGPDCPKARIKKFEKLAVVCHLGAPSPQSSIAAQIIHDLQKIGVKRLLVEGGGGLMWDFAKLNLIDEVNLTLTPRIVGGVHAPTLVDGIGFEPREIVNLKLKSCRRLGDELYLVYKKSLRRGAF